MVKYFIFIQIHSTYLISWPIVWNIYFSSNIFKSTIGTSIFVAGTTTTSSTWKSYGIVVMADHYDYKNFFLKNMWCWILFEEGLMEYSARRTTIVQAYQKTDLWYCELYIMYVLYWSITCCWEGWNDQFGHWKCLAFWPQIETNNDNNNANDITKFICGAVSS